MGRRGDQESVQGEKGRNMSTPRNQSVIKAFRMLKSFARPDEWLTSSELSRRAGLPEASGYRLIQTLEELGAVVRGPRGRYRPGMLLLSLSRNVDIGNLLHEASQGMIVELARRLDVTLHIGMLEDDMVTYVSKVGTPTSFSSHTQLGAQLEAYCSGLGKVLLAALPEPEARAIHLGRRAYRPHPLHDHRPRPHCARIWRKSAARALPSTIARCARTCAASRCRSTTRKGRSSRRCRPPSAPTAWSRNGWRRCVTRSSRRRPASRRKVFPADAPARLPTPPRRRRALQRHDLRNPRDGLNR